MSVTTKPEKLLECDYLVVGAGAAPLAFIDTLLTELPESKIILIDKKEIPGGHWVDAYGFVHLHQPSLVYGLASKQLEGNWLKLMLSKFMFPWKHRANKDEILTYFGKFVSEKVISQQVDFYPSSIYDFEKGENGSHFSDVDGHSFHYFSSVDGTLSYKVKVNEKLIDGTQGACIIPHDSPLQFPVDEDARVMTPNQIYDAFEGESEESKLLLQNKFVVIGAGKTGMDCIIYLQRTKKVDPADIAWVISNDVWMTNLGGAGTFWDFPKYLANCDNDMQKAALAAEEKGLFVRLDKKFMPTKFRFPLILPDELKLLRNVETVIRRGRATAIVRKNNSDVRVEFGSGNSPWTAFAPIEKCVFIHASSPGPFNDIDPETPFFTNSKKMTLNQLFFPPISYSMSTLAKIEATRRKGTLDIDFMKQLALTWGEEKLEQNECTENDLLKMLLLPTDLTKNLFQPLIVQAIVFAILDRDPMVAINWMKQNRLSFLCTLPGFKCETCDHVRLICSKAKSIGLSESDVRMLEMVGEKIKPLEGM